MLLCKGREAFSGDMEDASACFSGIGHPIPPANKPAEDFLDLVNTDFSSNSKVDRILDLWKENRPKGVDSSHGKLSDSIRDDSQEGIVDPLKISFLHEISIMFPRHFLLILRDPVLCFGRYFIFFFANTFVGFVYWNASAFTQDQATNKMWSIIWYVGVPSDMGVVAVYGLNDEFKSITGETKNCMVSAISSLLAKTVRVIAIMSIFDIFSLGVPGVAIQIFLIKSFYWSIIFFSALIYLFECTAELLAVALDDPILGMNLRLLLSCSEVS